MPRPDALACPVTARNISLSILILDSRPRPSLAELRNVLLSARFEGTSCHFNVHRRLIA